VSNTIDILPTNGFYVSDSIPVSAQECLNWYVNAPQTTAKSKKQLFGTPGISEIANTGEVSQQNRASIVLNGVPYFVNGNSLYRLNEDHSVDSLGFIEGSGRVSVAQNGVQIVLLIPGGKGYVYTPSPDSIVEITDPDFRANGDPQYVVFIDGYFVFTTDSKKFIVSAINDATSYNALDFGSAEANPDNTVVPFVFKNQLFIAGEITTEAFQNVGGSGFPFTRSGLYLSKGVSSPLSVVESSDTIMWIGSGKNESPAIWAFVGSTVKKISTTAIDNFLQELSDSSLEQTFSWSYSEKGAYFVGFSIGSTTFVFETITGLWSERKSIINDELVEYRVSSMVNAYGSMIVFDRIDGRIGLMSKDYYKEYGNTIIRRASSPVIHAQGKRIFIPQVELEAEMGVGNSEFPNPQILLDLSPDGGKTWVDQRSRGSGKIGEYNRRAIWRRLGRYANDVVFRFTMTDAVKPVLISAYAKVK